MHAGCAVSDLERVARSGLVGAAELALASGLFGACAEADLPEASATVLRVFLELRRNYVCINSCRLPGF